MLASTTKVHSLQLNELSGAGYCPRVQFSPINSQVQTGRVSRRISQHPESLVLVGLANHNENRQTET
jgi:hypothetical protein